MTFTKRRPNSPNLEVLDIDTDDARALRSSIKSSNFMEAERVLSNAKSSSIRTYLIDAAADWTCTIPQLTDWASKNSQIAQSVFAVHRAKMAWNYSSWTHGRSDPQMFQSEVEAGANWFDQNAAMNPMDTSLDFWRIWLARARFDQDRARHIATESLKIEPRNIFVASSTLYNESPSWFGSKPLVIETAKDLASRVPAESGSHALIVEAHYLNSFEDPSQWASDAVVQDITDAHQSNSVMSISSATDFRASHWLAWGLCKIGKHDLARPYFENLSGDAPGTPWGSLRFGLDTIFSAYRKQRKKSLNTV